MPRDSLDTLHDLLMNRRPSAQRVIDAYPRVDELKNADCRPLFEIHPSAERVLAMPRAQGAPFGATAQRQWAKREQIHARLRIARKGH